MTEGPVAIMGLGRSGVSAAKAALALGMGVIAVDEKPAEDPAIASAVRELVALGIEAHPGWNRGFWETGAKILVTSPGVRKDHELLQEAVRNGIEVISEVELAFRIAKDPIVAITGTNGKSTTTVMAWFCAKAAGFDAVLCGNIYGSGYDEVPLTEAASPQAPSSSAKEEGARALIAEISSFQLEWVDQFRPKAATITNITPDHLNRYADFEDYARTKRRIFDRMGPGDVAVWHCGDGLTEPPAGIRTLSYGEGGDHAWVDERRMHLLGEFIPLDRLPFREPHNYLNAMAAALLAYGLSDRRADPLALLEALTRFEPLDHRMEQLGERDGILVINNSMCTNPAAVIASSQAIVRPQRLLVGGSNKRLDFGVLGDYLRKTGHVAYLFGGDARSIGEQLGGDYPVFNTLAEAFDAAIRDARSGEAIMLAPGVASTDQFADFRDRGVAFRHMAREWLNGGCQGVADENVDQ